MKSAVPEMTPGCLFALINEYNRFTGDSIIASIRFPTMRSLFILTRSAIPQDGCFGGAESYIVGFALNGRRLLGNFYGTVLFKGWLTAGFSSKLCPRH